MLSIGTGGIHTRDIVGAPLRVEGVNHGEADYDDAWLIALIGESDAFLDIGCNIGFFSLAACVLRPEAHVLAIDANPDCAAVTAANLVRNGFGDRARALSLFVSDHRGEVQFFTEGTGAAGSAIQGMAQTAEGQGLSTTVATDTIDAITGRLGFAPDLVKVDVEGAEREVLHGATTTTRTHRPRYLVEMHRTPTTPMAENAAGVLEWCAANDYAAWYLSEGTRITEPGPLAHRGRCHLLLQPDEAALPGVLGGIRQGAPISEALARISGLGVASAPV